MTSRKHDDTCVALRPDAPGLFIALAPMDGVTDGSYREVITAMFGGRSGISVCVSEFVRVLRQPVTEAVFLRHCPELARGGQTRAGVPVFVQLLGGDPLWMAQAAARAAALGAPGIDLNFGCPAKTVNNSDGGATLLKRPCRVEQVTRAVRAAVPESIPVTVKVRVGWDDAAPMVDIAMAAEQGGATWLTIHGRTRTQLYKPPVDWHAIGRAREAVSMPVVANGDLFSVDALRRCASVSGCSAFMIGRGAMGRPELFAQARGWFDQQSLSGGAGQAWWRSATDTQSLSGGAGQAWWRSATDTQSLSGGAGQAWWRSATDTQSLSGVEVRGLLLRYVAQLLADGAGEHATLGRLKQWLRMGGLLRADMAQWFEDIKRLQTLADAQAVLLATDHADQARAHGLRQIQL